MSVYLSPYDARNSYSTLNRPFNGPVVTSLVGHIAFLLLIVFGIPYVAKHPEVLYEPISVEVISSSQLDDNNSQPEPAAAEPAPPPMREQAPTMIEETPPAPVEPEPVIETSVPEPSVPPPPIETPDSEVEEVKAEPKTPLPIRKPKPPANFKKPAEEEKPVEKPKNAMSALLKNLTESEPTPPPSVDVSQQQTATTSGIGGGQLTLGEKDAIKAQMVACWNIRAGAKYAEDLAVEIRLVMNTDRTVRSATILDQARYNRDPVFRSAADAAQRAVFNPRCSPLALPPAKYAEWKTFILNFDPKDML